LDDVDVMNEEADCVAYLKEPLVIYNEEDTDGRGRVTTDEERVVQSTD